MSRLIHTPLKRWRLAQDRTVSDLAGLIPCTRQTWHSWERGASIPPPVMMAALVALTDGAVTANDFYATGRDASA